MKVFMTQNMEPEGVTIIERVANVVSPSHLNPLSREEFLSGVTDADGVIMVWHTERMDREAFDKAPNLKVVVRKGVGYDNIDVAEATRRGVYVAVCPLNIPTIADTAFGLILCAARRFPQANQFVRTGQWTEGGAWVALKFLGQNVHHSTLGIIGLGRIGQEVAKRAQGFDMKVLYYDAIRRPEMETRMGITFAPLEELLATADFVSINCALNESTHHIINERTIRMMKSTAILVNTSRGPTVDLDALYRALKDGRLGGAGLDVFEPEPVPVDHPILALENVVFTPHLGTSTMGTRIQIAESVARGIVSVLSGEEPEFLLNPEVRRVRPLKPHGTVLSS
jgi:lactate dehydrogenase-like 2-hydroxyacid dehydrogenase